jgi:DNA-binding NarL/FixJ family response regulator
MPPADAVGGARVGGRCRGWCMDAATAGGQESASPLPAAYIGILFVCAVRLLATGLVELLESKAGIAIVAHAGTSEEALAYICRTPPPDIILIDAALPQELAIVRRFRQVDPRVRCVPFGVGDALDTTSLWTEAGAVGFVRRSASLAELIGVLGGVMRSDRAHDCSPQPNVFPPMLLPCRHKQVPTPRRPVLTRRKRQVLEQIYAGCSNKEIARCLGIEPATVKRHVHNLLAKLKVQRRG